MLRNILEEETLVENGVPAAELIVTRYDEVLFHEAHGKDGNGEPLEVNMLFDIASLTKPVATASAIFLLHCDGKISLDEELAGNTIRDILLHRTNLPENLDWQKIDQPDLQMPDVVGLVNEAPTQAEIGYSNSGYVLLSSYVESMVGDSMESFLKDHLWNDLNMKDTTFLPKRNLSVPTATDQEQGRPFDPLADFFVTSLDKTPGHSGLFSTAEDLNKFAQAALLFSRSSNAMDDVELKNSVSKENQILFCWAKNLTDETEWGRSYGFDVIESGALVQTGYTGCVMYLHPETGISYILLTNKTLNESPNFERLEQRVLHVIDPATKPPYL